MKTRHLSLPAAVVAALGSALFVVTTVAQAPQEAPPAGPPGMGGMHHGPAPKPTNLKVLPQDLTGDQVMNIMHKWEADLGSECTTCHTPDPTRKMPNGHPALNFADDSKPEKQAARMMFTMMQLANKDYVSKLPKTEKGSEEAMVTCGTCHRGHLNPPEFVPPKEHEHEHEHPDGAQPPIPH